MDVGSILWILAVGVAGLTVVVTAYLQMAYERTPPSVREVHSVVSKHCKSCNKIIIGDAGNIQFCSTCGARYE